ncbi:MAG: NAD(P)-dependent oxidoreductase [Alphaproteobacteria bacterium]|nr:MAG: NAD(P)-dependent oxidoreductase [Alphaproteobacteria bacterium]
MTESALDSAGAVDLSGRTVGFLGFGLMGRPMAARLVAAGAEVIGWTRSGALPSTVTAAATPLAVARRADRLILMLADTPAVEAVVFGPEGVAGGLSHGSLVIDMGTTAVAATRGFAQRLAALGASWVDAPVSGGTVAAEAGTLTIMAGGAPEALAAARPFFQAIGRRITDVGSVGAGQVAKTCNQLIVGLTIAAVSEALALARAAGVDPALVRDAIRGGFAESRILDLHGQRMIERSFTPGGKVTTQVKDLMQAEALASASGIDLSVLSAVRARFDALVEVGGGALDHSALYTLFDPPAHQ